MSPIAINPPIDALAPVVESIVDADEFGRGSGVEPKRDTLRGRARREAEEQKALLVKLHEASTLAVRENDLNSALQTVLDAVIVATHADFGNIQVVNERTGALEIVAQRGFGSEFLEFFGAVHDGFGACGTAKARGERVVVENVVADPIFAGAAVQGVMTRAGVRAIQSTPLVGRFGGFLGMVSTHFREPHRPEDAELRTVDLFARQAADAIELHRIRAEQKQACEAMQVADRAKDEFLAMLGHELRNPLAPIVLALNLLKQRNCTDAPEYQIIERHVRHLIRLVDDLLDISRIVSKQIELHRERVELGGPITNAIEAALPAIESKRQHLDVEVQREGLAVDADPVRVAQIFTNLLINAARYTPTEGHISISARREGSEVVVQVRDDGRGIEPELLPHVFEMFTQHRRAVDRSEGGLGLGLAVVKSFVEMHGGRVSAQSAGAGKGSTFAVALPLPVGDTPARADVPRPPSHGAEHCLRVLVVEDNAETAELVVAGLRNAGHKAESAPEGVAALAMLSRFSPDVALIDIGLPVMDGYELARVIVAEHTERVPILIALTGYGQPLDFEKSHRAGFHAHLVKPIELATLLQVLSSLPVRKSRLART